LSLRVGIDAHHLNGKPQGSRTYLFQLIRALASLEERANAELRIYSFHPKRTDDELAIPNLVHRRVFPESAKLRIPFVVPALELTDRLDVFHSQYIAPPVSFVPEVVTIHDVLFETHPELFQGAFSERSVRLIRRSALRARVVLTVSAFSRGEILDRYRLPEERVLVTPNAVNHESFRPLEIDPSILRDRYGLDGPFVLSVGRLEPRKNLERLIRAFGRARERFDKRLRLVLVGTEDFRCETILAEADRLPAGSVVRLGAVPDTDLPLIYNGALALAYPSLAEGFGMPLLEAMACGIPVLTAPRGALEEVGGDAVLFVDPLDEDAIAEGLERILGDSELRYRLSEAGKTRAAQFRWEETARRTMAAYRLAAQN
jgi:glycosyltransferase involved in cell wall biosynthesis